MIVKNKSSVKRLLAAACLAAACSQSAQAIEVGGLKLDDTVIIANRELKLNGAGVRYKAIFKVYAAALYLPEKKTTVAEILAMPGPRRMQLVMMRDVSSDELGRAFMKGLNSNSDKGEKSKLLTQTMQFGQMFALLQSLKKGDVLALDWIPGIGTQCQLNGRKIGEVMLDQAFYNAVLKIWLGDKPVDFLLKPELLGAAAR